MSLALLAATLGFGFRHGIDWDHIAALTDITGTQDTPRRSMRLATLYALGHALVVALLGVAAIALSASIPPGLDRIMQRFVGVTLVVLGGYVWASLIRHGREFKMRSRWMLLFDGLHRLTHRHNSHHSSPHVYGDRTAFGVGMIHGIGAETPTQVLIFLAAAGAGGTGVGIGLLACFLVGLLASNTLVALGATFGFARSTRSFGLYACVSALTATLSLGVGAVFILGHAAFLPALLRGA